MSDTNVGASIPAQPTAGQAPTGQAETGPSTTPGRRAERPTPEQTGWVGWIVFGGTMMIMLGAFHAFQGLIALFQDNYYLVPKAGLTVHVSYTGWGWTHLVLGVLVAAAGAGLLAGQMWARIVGVALAFISAIVNVAFLAAYPAWSLMMVAIDVLVIWAITVHGREMRTTGSSA
ncbi:MAG: DUF7144 family membrane protein [Oryzihumus sp.]